ncbi:MAG: DUF2871 family protein [Bowdeniella nasicola]|nr:DUF2871 family protein [Bowdeniella nasicola]
MMSTTSERFELGDRTAAHRAALWSAIYTAAGLLAGLGYRELTRNASASGGQLAIMHTHLLTLGTVMMLVVTILVTIFPLARQRTYRPFFITYHIGVILTVGMQAVIGYRELNGAADSAMLNGIAGLGHITITAAFVLFFLALLPAIRTQAPAVAPAQVAS